MSALAFHGPGLGRTTITMSDDDAVTKTVRDLLGALREDKKALWFSGTAIKKSDDGESEWEESSLFFVPLTTPLEFIFDGDIPEDLLDEAMGPPDDEADDEADDKEGTPHE